jgi:hypothetical protein
MYSFLLQCLWSVRVRPPNKREQSGSGGGVCVKVSDGTVRVERQPFAFDVTFPMECTQLEVFEAIGVDIVQCAFHGYNGTSLCLEMNLEDTHHPYIMYFVHAPTSYFHICLRFSICVNNSVVHLSYRTHNHNCLFLLI